MKTNVEDINDEFAEFQNYLSKKDKHLKLLVKYDLLEDLDIDDLRF